MKIPYTKVDDATLATWLQAARDGDTAARNRVITHTMRLVVRLAAAYAKRHNRQDLVDDMIQAAVMGARGTGKLTGVVGAIDTYEPARGKWSTYVTGAVMLACSAVLRDGAVAPVGVRWRQARVRNAAAALRTQHGREPTPEEVCDTIRRSSPDNTWARPRAISRMLAAPVIELSWEAETEEAPGLGGALTSRARQCLSDPNAVDEDDIIEAIDGQRAAARGALALDVLTPRERDVVSASYGLAAPRETDVEIAERLAISARYVGKIRLGALRKLQRKAGAVT